MKVLTLSYASIWWLRQNKVFFEGNRELIRLRPGEVLAFYPDTEVEPYCCLLAGPGIPQIGSFSYTLSSLQPGMTIGRYCSIANGLSVPGPSHPFSAISTSPFLYDPTCGNMQQHIEDMQVPYDDYVANPQKPPPVIGNDVWIGLNAVIMPGVTIGDGAIIAANSVVTKDVEPFMIMGGNPAKAIRPRFEAPVIEKLKASQWWQYSFTAFHGKPLNDPERLAEMVMEEAAKGVLKPYQPQKVALRDIPA